MISRPLSDNILLIFFLFFLASLKCLSSLVRSVATWHDILITYARPYSLYRLKRSIKTFSISDKLSFDKKCRVAKTGSFKSRWIFNGASCSTQQYNKINSWLGCCWSVNIIDRFSLTDSSTLLFLHCRTTIWSVNLLKLKQYKIKLQLDCPKAVAPGANSFIKDVTNVNLL